MDEQRLVALRRRYAGLDARQIDAARARRRAVFVIVLLAALGMLAYLVLPSVRSAFEAKGSARIESQPPGATVILDGQRMGTTPLTIDNLAVGEHQAELRHPYTDPATLALVIEADAVTLEHVDLHPRRVNLRVLSSPVGAAIELDGEATGRVTPYTFEVEAGVHRVAVGLPGRSRAHGTIEVREDSDWRGELNIIPSGRLTLSTRPAGARIELLDSGETYHPGMSLPVGEYVARVSAPGYETRAIRVQIRQDLDTRESVELTRLTGPLVVRTEPPGAAIEVKVDNRPVAWRPGAAVPTGRVTVTARLLGYRASTRSLDLGQRGATVRLQLAPMDVEVGATFRDTLRSTGGEGPLMVIVPAGRFEMGDIDGSGYADERPVHEVEISQPFAIGVYEVTRREFAAFSGEPVADDKADLPVTHVSHEQARAYAAWLGRETSASYRLPSEAEWEYAARAGTRTRFFFGSEDRELCRYANVADLSAKRLYRDWQVVDCDDGYPQEAPVGRFEANRWGLHDVYGNAAEWVADCWHRNYRDAPGNGASWGDFDCRDRMVRGGSWDSRADATRSAFRNSASQPGEDRGFRVVRDL